MPDSVATMNSFPLFAFAACQIISCVEKKYDSRFILPEETRAMHSTAHPHSGCTRSTASGYRSIASSSAWRLIFCSCTWHAPSKGSRRSPRIHSFVCFAGILSHGIFKHLEAVSRGKDGKTFRLCLGRRIHVRKNDAVGILFLP